MKRREFIAAAAAAIPSWLLPLDALAQGRPYLAAFSAQRALAYIKDGRAEWIIEPMAVGSGGFAEHRVRGGNVTPMGSFTLSWVNPQSRFRLFFGFNYPLPAHAERGRREGIISSDEYRSIMAAHEGGKTPPQTTRLGGYIGLHGLGGRSRQIHGQRNWTRGCLAVDDPSIDRIGKLVSVGTRIFIS
ncbi:hypothetical protein J2T57_001389 [Natronocella acetinitrilica]|uniref:L,D-TPase catalytic domain-containing protein n=1 Tax=Natronocella acetinitrilica TaxID=414046 RepID=A0AAE3KFP4_9GAMM|nr:L,D-transpeptidase [Natronocella acetinitrilica]MCP1674287.1 hypothetical protein [Natronocella acetinitrilica]